MIYRTLLKLLIINSITVLSLAACSKTRNTDVPTPVVNREPYIEWDQQSRRKVSSALNAGYSGYARMIQLPDASLLCVYEADGSIIAVKSSDLGNTWSQPVVVAPRANGTNMCVPDLILLKDQSILACYNGRPFQISPDRKFSIRLKKSTDGGLSWNEEKLLYEAGHQFENGCWEPAAIQLPSGEIQLYFANEGPYTNSNEQNISMLRSSDNGASWSSNPAIISFRPGKRDGMPVPLLLKNGKDIVVAIEDNAVNTFKPYILKNTLQQNWAATIPAESPNRWYAMAERIGEEIYAGAPYIRQLSTGETILSYQGTEGRTNDMNFADMKVVIGNDQATDFKHKSVPFLIPANKSCLWNSITVLSDDTVIAIASTNAYSEKTEVWMIKGKLIKDTTH